MEWIRINDNKLKIMLTSSDMKNYALDAQAFSCETEQTRRAFRSILRDTGVGGDFEQGRDKIYVQYYPSREGGCEMFVTRLDQLCDVEASQQDPKKQSDRQITAADAPPQLLLFHFGSLEGLLLACRHLHAASNDRRLLRTSAAYHDGEARFYLALTPYPPEQESDSCVYETVCRLAGEFGTQLPCRKDTAIAYITEHTAPICPTRAVEALGTLC